MQRFALILLSVKTVLWLLCNLTQKTIMTVTSNED